MTDAIEITHDTAGHRFVHRDDGHEAELTYRVDADRLVLDHTEVPDALGGRGVAGRLVQAAVDHAVDTGAVVVPVCPYVRSWLEKNPDQADRVTVEDPPRDG